MEGVEISRSAPRRAVVIVMADTIQKENEVSDIGTRTRYLLLKNKPYIPCYHRFVQVIKANKSILKILKFFLTPDPVREAVEVN